MSSGDSAPDPPVRASVIPLLPVWRVDRAFDYLVPDSLVKKVHIGSLVRVPFGKRKVRGLVVALDSGEASTERELQPISDSVIDVPIAPPPMHDLIDWVARRYAVARGVAYARVVPPRVRVTNLRFEPVVSAPETNDGGALVRSYANGAVLLDAIHSGGSGIWSLRCLPTHDRGELIAELVSAVGDRGAALVTVPEVKYGSFVLDHLEKKWPDLARVDSAQDDADRARAWLSLAAGHGLGAGGRASLLAPMPALRLLVVDEEHHSSYKEDRSPRYHARTVAVERARLQGALCVLVSATPSLETSLAVAKGEWREAHADRNERRAARPIVEVVPVPDDRAIGPDLHARMRAVLRAGKRVGLLVPSRGYARALWCASCRRSLRCPVCEAGLFYDRSGKQGATVRCARCGFGNRAPDVCPKCHASDWRYVGGGSERLEGQIAKAFPRAAVQRVDPSVLDSGGNHEYSSADVYVTTWVGTKPTLRPEVGLVGVLNADALIRRAEFRSAESAYQALSEMAHWAGPASEEGRLIIQSSDPGHHAVQAVVRADHEYFARRELEARREAGYPPWQELIKITASGSQAEAIMRAAADIARGLISAPRGSVLGPIPVHRSTPEGPTVDLEILVKCPDATAVAEGFRELLGATPPGRLKIDTDPR